MIKRICTFSITLLSCINLFSQVPNWLWAIGSGGNGFDAGVRVCADANSNIYVAGNFASNTITFGTVILTNAGGSCGGPGVCNDVFLTKQDNSGNYLWAKRAGGNSDDVAVGSATDIYNNIYVIGNFRSSSIAFGNTTLTNSSIDTNDIFLAKYDALGNVIWAKRIGGGAQDDAASICTDSNGEVYVCGNFKSAFLTVGSTTLVNALTGNSDMFIAKFDTSGASLWAQRFGGTMEDISTSISLVNNASIYLAGSFNSPSISFGSITLTNTTIGTGDISITRFDTSGNIIWAKGIGGTNYDIAYVSMNSNADIFLAGHYGDTMQIANDTLIASGGKDVFIAKFDASGTAVWGRSFGGNQHDICASITTDLNNNFYITGYFVSSTIAFSSFILTSPGNFTIFVTKFDASGNVVWATSPGGGNAIDIGDCIATDSFGHVLLTGIYGSSTVSFGSTTLPNPNGTDMFIAKMDAVTGIIDLKSPKTFAIYPNPSARSFYLSFDEKIIRGKITLLNVFGDIVYEDAILNESKKEININILSQGIYFVKVFEGKMSYCNKLIVE